MYIFTRKKKKRRERKVHDWHIFHVNKWDEKSCKSSVSERYTIQMNKYVESDLDFPTGESEQFYNT